MRIIKAEKRLCECCMEEHEVKTVTINDSIIFKGRKVSFDAISFYCDNADEYFENEAMIDMNDISMKDAYRRDMGLLTSNEITAIRNKYCISQSDLSLVLGWGAKTITRYESHQVQDLAHDAILRKINNDPEWFLYLLDSAKSVLSQKAYEKYYKVGMALYESENDAYLKKAILSKYANVINKPQYTGGSILDFERIVDVVNYYAGSSKVRHLFKVKLMKMLWYTDALSYKLRGHSMMGLAYQCLPMGAAPLAYDLLIELNGINYEEIEIGDGTACKFVPNRKKSFKHLSDDDRQILDRVINEFGSNTTEEIVFSMHSELAYVRTKPKKLIDYKYANELSIE